MSIIRKLFGLGPKVDCHELLANGAILIDVRTPGEFAMGKAKGSKNVPLDKIMHQVKQLEKIKKPIVLCCRSGMRSGRATSMLKRHGIQEVYNGGPWNKFA